MKHEPIYFDLKFHLIQVHSTIFIDFSAERTLNYDQKNLSVKLWSWKLPMR